MGRDQWTGPLCRGLELLRMASRARRDTDVRQPSPSGGQRGRVVRIGESLARLVELLVRLRIGRDKCHMPELARIWERLVEVDQPLQVSLLFDEPAKLATPTFGSQLAARCLQLGNP